jgi:hypothetical protein
MIEKFYFVVSVTGISTPNTREYATGNYNNYNNNAVSTLEYIYDINKKI